MSFIYPRAFVIIAVLFMTTMGTGLSSGTARASGRTPPVHADARFFLPKDATAGRAAAAHLREVAFRFPELLSGKQLDSLLSRSDCRFRLMIAGILLKKGFVDRSEHALGTCRAPVLRAGIFASRGQDLQALLTAPVDSTLFRRLIYRLFPSILVAYGHLAGLGAISGSHRAAVKTFLLAQAHILAALAAGGEDDWSRVTRGYALVRAGFRQAAASWLDSFTCRKASQEVRRRYWLSKARGVSFKRFTSGPVGWWYSLVSSGERLLKKCIPHEVRPKVPARIVRKLWRCSTLDTRPSACANLIPRSSNPKLPSPYEGCPPLPWLRYFRQASQRHAVPLGLLYGIAWTESRFSPLAISRADAVGMFQMTPQVAYTEAKAAGIKYFTMGMLVRPKLSVMLAAAHLRRLHDSLGGWIQAVAAYNAGEAEARRWFTEMALRSVPDIVEEITFDETRSYVKSVLATWWLYANSYSWDQDTATILTAVGLN